MAFNPYGLSRPETREVTRTFVDPLHPDMPIVVRLRSVVGYNEQVRVNKAAQQLVEDFVTGKEGRPPAPVVLPGLGVFNPSETLAFQVGFLVAMQVPGDGVDTLDAFGWFATSEVAPNAFLEIMAFMREMSQLEPPGNASGEHTDTPSVAP